MLPTHQTYKIILLFVALFVLIASAVLFFIPPALFPDPANGLQVLRCMQLGGRFNTLSTPDQSDISQNLQHFLTWWSPGQYLVPFFFKLAAQLNTGRAIAVTITLAQLCGLSGFYFFFKKLGFTPVVAAVSLLFIICQLAFYIPYVFYNGGEVLIFAFEGWFLYGCVALQKPGWKLVLFVILSGWIGFFCKSSFIWIYAAGLCCLWIRLSLNSTAFIKWVKRGLWIGIPAVLSVAAIYLFFLSKGESPATVSKGIKLTAETFSFPLAAPILSGFSVDDLCHGLIYYFGKPMFAHYQAVVILIMLAILSLSLIVCMIRYVPKKDYRLFVIVFYFGSLLFFGIAYLQQLNISYEARHFRVIGILIMPGMIYLVSRLRRAYQLIFSVLSISVALFSFNYLVKGFRANNLSARGITGISQINIDQQSLNTIMKLDRENRNATFVFINNDIGLEVIHNRIINLPTIGDDLKIDTDDFTYEGYSGLLFIVLPESYNGPKEKLIMKSFPGYTGFNLSMLSDNYVLYSARMKR